MQRGKGVACLTTAAVLSLALAAAPASAGLVWSEDFTGELNGAAPSSDYLGGTPSNDWGAVTNTVNNGSVSLAVNTSVGNAAPALTLNDASTSNTTFVGANFGNFAPFNMATAGQERLTLSLEVRFDAYGNANNGSNSMLRLFLRDAGSSTNAIAIAFGRAALNDGDASDDIFLVVDKGDAPAAGVANAVGFTGSGWAPGFDFGNWSATDADNDTHDAFYHFDLLFEKDNANVAVTAYPVANPEQAIAFTRTMANPLLFSNTGTDVLSLQAGSAARGTLHVDNLRFVSSAIPEPAGLTTLGLGALMMLRRRRRGG